MKSNGVDISHVEDKLIELEKQGKTVMILAVDEKVAGLIAAMDTPKEGAAEAIRQLKDMGFEVIMLTGDDKRTASAIAKHLGIDKVIAIFLPVRRLTLSGNCRARVKLWLWLATELMMLQP